MENNLLKALLNKVDEVLIGKSDVASASKDNYVAWCSPGIPFQSEDLQFAIKGINGADAEQTVSLIRNAAEFARLVNSVPSSNTIGGTFEQNGTMVWDVYKNVLSLSKVVKDDITPEQEAKIKKLRGLLTTTKKVIDIVTDEEKMMTVDSPMVVAYNEKMGLYNNALAEYNNKRLSALNADSKQAVQDFAMNAGIYRSKVKQTLNDWTTNGYKDDMEKIAAYIGQISQRSMMLIKADLQDKLDKGKMTDPTSGSDFYFSSLYPGSFINSDNGWTQFTFDSSSKSTYLKEEHSNTSGSSSVNWGLWKASANAGATKDSLNKSMETADFSMKFKITQTPLGRGWFSPDFLTNNQWSWPAENGMLSDGKTPPTGKLIAYPTTAVFIKDVEIKSSAMSDVYSEMSKTLTAGGSVGWGPFNVGANHSSNSKEVSTEFDSKTNTLKIEGMQLIAFKCFALPLTPNCDKKELQ